MDIGIISLSALMWWEKIPQTNKIGFIFPCILLFSFVMWHLSLGASHSMRYREIEVLILTSLVYEFIRFVCCV